MLSQLRAEWAATVRQMVTLAMQVIYSGKFNRSGEKKKNTDNNTYHLKQPPEQESHTYRFRTGKVQLIAQCGCKNKIKQICMRKKNMVPCYFISTAPLTTSWELNLTVHLSCLNGEEWKTNQSQSWTAHLSERGFQGRTHTLLHW